MIKIGNTWVKKYQESKRIMSMTHTLKMSHHGVTTIFERHTKRGVRGEDLLTEGLITNSSTPGNKSPRPMKYIKFYFDEWTLSTRMLTAEEKGAWADLMVAYCTSETPGEIRLSKRGLARFFGFTSTKSTRILETLSTYGLCEIEKVGEDFVIKSNRLLRKVEQQNQLTLIRKIAASGSKPTKVPSKCLAKEKQKTPYTKDERLNTKLKKKNKKKGPPTLDEIKTFCATRSISEETAETFFNYYEGRNLWTNKNGQLINWFFMIQNDPWKNNGNNRSNNNGSPRRIDRNKGTTNEGRASQYEGVGRVARD